MDKDKDTEIGSAVDMLEKTERSMDTVLTKEKEASADGTEQLVVGKTVLSP